MKAFFFPQANKILHGSVKLWATDSGLLGWTLSYY